MINKQNLWFITLFSLILILGIYYVSMPKDALTVFSGNTNDSSTTIEVSESDVIVALKVEEEEKILAAMEDAQKVLLDETTSITEKNEAYETLQLLNSKKGKVLEIYPESRLPLKHEKNILPFKPSFVYLALESNAPIIPVYTNGEYNTKKRTKVLIGEKIYLRELYDDSKSEKENIDYLCNYVRDYIERLEGIINEETNQK